VRGAWAGGRTPSAPPRALGQGWDGVTSPVRAASVRPDRVIPFDAFAPLGPPSEVIEDSFTSDVSATDAAVPVGCSEQEPVPVPGVVMPEEAGALRRPARVGPPPGYVVLAVSEALAGDAAAEIFATQLCRLIERQLPVPVFAVELLDQHAPASDLRHWAAVDVARAEVAEAIGLTLCAHDLAEAPGRQILTAELPRDRLAVLLRAVGEAPGGRAGRPLVDPTHASPEAAGTDDADRRVTPSADDAGPRTALPPGDAGQDLALRAAVAHTGRTTGRALVFAGQQHLAEELPVSEVLARTAVRRVHSVHGDFHDDAVLCCHGYARPRFHDGLLTLAVGHDDPHRVVALEVRYSRPCCGEDH